MKFTLISFLLLISVLFGCDDQEKRSNQVDKLSLYWDHEIFGEEGRRVRFEFVAGNKFEQEHELLFEYDIDGHTIEIRLRNIVTKGDCQALPLPAPTPGDSLPCIARGRLFIPEEELETGTYTLSLLTPDFNETSQLVIDEEKITLNIAPNEHFSSTITEVYPIPENVLFGNVTYTGSENGVHATDFFKDLANMGLETKIMSPYPYGHLMVDTEGNAIENHWEPDNHSIGFIYDLNQDFKPIFELARQHFFNSQLNIYLFSSNGDQASLDQVAGVNVVFAE